RTDIHDGTSIFRAILLFAAWKVTSMVLSVFGAERGSTFLIVATASRARDVLDAAVTTDTFPAHNMTAADAPGQDRTQQNQYPDSVASNRSPISSRLCRLLVSVVQPSWTKA